MCMRCESLKYVYGSSVRPYRESLYVTVIIGVNAVVYVVCKCARRFNPSPIHIKGLVSQSLEVFLKKIDVCRVHIEFAKFRGFFHKIALNRLRDDFVKV